MKKENTEVIKENSEVKSKNIVLKNENALMKNKIAELENKQLRINSSSSSSSFASSSSSFVDTTTPLEDIIVPNPHGMFKLEGRKMIFQCDDEWDNRRSLILKEKISDKVFEVFVLFLLIFNTIIILFMFLCFTGR
jgi:hypothetical protein